MTSHSPSRSAVLVGFTAHSAVHLEPSMVALLGARALVTLSRLDADESLEEMEWPTPAFFMGLFIMVGASPDVVIIGIAARNGPDLLLALHPLRRRCRRRHDCRGLALPLAAVLPHRLSTIGGSRCSARSASVSLMADSPAPPRVYQERGRRKGVEPTMGTVPEPAEPPRWVTTRVAHPVRDLGRSEAFYRDLLGLRSRGGFTGHDGYDGAFFALPGGGELELTTGPAEPRPGTEEDLLVLYLRSLEEVRRTAADLERAGVPSLNPANPYWARWGRTFLDPDDNAVVIAAVPPDPITTGPVRVERFSGSRDELRGLFELAEDSPTQLDSYFHAGRLLVAVAATHVIGYLQVVDTAEPRHFEIKSMAVRAELQGRGVGALLVQGAIDLLTDESGTSLAVATAAADVGNLRFYQRQGFRMRSVERDAFGPATGYPPGIRVDGIELRDRVWLDYPITRALPR